MKTSILGININYMHVGHGKNLILLHVGGFVWIILIILLMI